jgi:ankyrin repeat protein
MKKIGFIAFVALLVLAAASVVCFADANDDLYDAAQRGDVEKVRMLLARGANFNVIDKISGQTPLTIAAYFGHIETVKLLLDHGVPVDQQNNDGATALVFAASTEFAASNADSELVRLLLARGADVNHRDKYGRTPLFEAACHDCKPGNAQLLLAKGADVNAQDNKGKTAFYYAQINANQGVIAVLVKAGANGGKMPEATTTALTVADQKFLITECKIEQSDIDVISKLDADTQKMLLSRITMRNCSLFNSFTASRKYFRQLKPNVALPTPPADWDISYLTDEEIKQYEKILDKEPW